MTQIIFSISKRVVFFAVQFVLIIGLFSFATPIIAHAECDWGSIDKITVTSIFIPSSYFPIIPAECGVAGNQPVALTLDDLPPVLIRGFGFLASLIAYLLFFNTVISGLQWIYGGIDGSQATRAKQNLQDGLVGIILILSVYIIVTTILTVLRVPINSNSSFDDYIQII